MLTSRFGSRVVSNQRSMPSGDELAEPGGDVVRLVVQGEVGAQGLAELDLLRAAGRRGDPGAGGLGHLDDHRAQAAAASGDVDSLARVKLPLVEQAEVRRDPHQGLAGGLGVGLVWRGRIGEGLVDRGELGRGPLAAEHPQVRPPDPVADLVTGRAGAEGLDRPGEVGPADERERHRHRHHPRPDVEVDRVQGRRADPHQDLAGARLGAGQVADLDGFGGAGLLDVGGSHGSEIPAR